MVTYPLRNEVHEWIWFRSFGFYQKQVKKFNDLVVCL